MRWSIFGLIIIGVILAASAAVLVNSFQTADQAAASQAQTVQIVTAAEDLSAMSIVQADSLAVQTVAFADAPVGYIQSPSRITGKVLTVAVREGQPLTDELFAVGGTGRTLAAALPEGMRAVTVSVGRRAATTDLLDPGCVVDVLASTGGTGSDPALSSTLLRNVQVLAVGSRTVFDDLEQEQEKAGSDESNHKVTLMVSADQAEKLHLAMRHGEIALAMRNPSETSLPKPVKVQSDAMAGELLGVLRRMAQRGEKPEVEPAAAMWETTIIRGRTVQTQRFRVAQ